MDMGCIVTSFPQTHSDTSYNHNKLLMLIRFYVHLISLSSLCLCARSDSEDWIRDPDSTARNKRIINAISKAVILMYMLLHDA